uniref:28S ribosomal protein S28, mitochondrial n=2 Tax=Caenorhabditis japonica TaxID=281687 RepID=A0A8R1DLH7_CAEJA
MLRSLFATRPALRQMSRIKKFSTEASTGGEESIIDFVETITETSEAQDKSFATLLRSSKFMQLGDFNGRLVVGKIVQRIQEDVYIDFGLKFNAVCKVPAVNSEAYRSGARVLIRLIDSELSERFLGSRKDLTLLEADAVLVRLLSNVPGSVRRPAQQQKPPPNVPVAPESSPENVANV